MSIIIIIIIIIQSVRVTIVDNLDFLNYCSSTTITDVAVRWLFLDDYYGTYGYIA